MFVFLSEDYQLSHIYSLICPKLFWMAIFKNDSKILENYRLRAAQWELWAKIVHKQKMNNLGFLRFLFAKMEVDTQKYHESYPFVSFLHEEEHSQSSNMAKMNIFQSYCNSYVLTNLTK